MVLILAINLRVLSRHSRFAATAPELRVRFSPRASI